ncbi:hypothetical protein [Campylobacter sp.]|uniref:hypothetical protein n=1 Tax=Campylobacter sp. TaxID=205 RepID=UPI002AA83C36|nr:hypothetical protein [Campylobacter sp.]MCI7581911.1 hypothetical protein [Campylobacter sp.]
MSKFNITEALIYENQGLKEEALEIYKKILESDPDNFKAAAHLRRLKKEMAEPNKEKLEIFLRLRDENEIKELKRWLISL